MQHFSFAFFPFFDFTTQLFFHSGYIIKPPQPSSAFYRQPILQLKNENGNDLAGAIVSPVQSLAETK